MTASAPVSSSVDAFQALANAQQAVDTARSAAKSVGETTLQGWSPELVKFLAVSILAFTIVALILCAILLWRSRASGYHVLRIFGVISIIGVSALLLAVGYSNEQLTPIVGLFGAVAGYLLGKDTTTHSPAPSTGMLATSPQATTITSPGDA